MFMGIWFVRILYSKIKAKYEKEKSTGTLELNSFWSEEIWNQVVQNDVTEVMDQVDQFDQFKTFGGRQFKDMVSSEFLM